MASFPKRRGLVPYPSKYFRGRLHLFAESQRYRIQPQLCTGAGRDKDAQRRSVHLPLGPLRTHLTMTTLNRLFNRGIQLVALLLSCACSSKSPPQEPPMTSSYQIDQSAVALVQNYIDKSKHWQKGSYQITLNRKEGEIL